ncbi:amino acid ABC transporter substrate-binding protein, PAAT family [Thalassolituus maritimus]|uniref:Amino acid ABC transporter substrate-binding protein, PAAT family n=1 Tax=Thalassolituus maritimus TaxID=484498 RepID=A0A1N7MWZ4_9GAMM|nr:transporter substrate-binding domain-containing protein [Thalassolituus maritimus]SIS90625.1 amino acid ABC transporter substrate-binding protein, PAAT family [Thalassolituus maritimus]
MLSRIVVSLVLLLGIPSFAVAEDKVVRLATLEWAPYTSQTLKHQGATTEVVRRSFKAMGYELQIMFYPWERAVKMGSDGSYGLDGFFPEYYREDVNDGVVFSDPVGYGPLGFAERVNRVIDWNKLEDLTPYTIGTVQGYANTLEFDERVAEQTLNVSEAMTDVTNLMKLVYGRVDLSVIDQHVFAYLLATNPELNAVRGQLLFDQTLLEIKSLYVCFNKDNAHLAEILNQGLAKIDIRAIQDEIFSDYYPDQ